jgi:hypothetical protein
MEKFDTSEQATDDNIIWHMCFACLMTNATYIHTEYFDAILEIESFITVLPI